MPARSQYIHSVWHYLRLKNPKLPEKVWSYDTYVLFNDAGEIKIDVFVEHLATDAATGSGRREIFSITAKVTSVDDPL